MVPLLAGGGMFETGAGAFFFCVCVCTYPRGSMYGLYTYIYHANQPHVGKYTIHGSYGYVCVFFWCEGHKDAWALLGRGLLCPKSHK